jgi:Carboxypeptidase regulatory-like domain
MKQAMKLWALVAVAAFAFTGGPAEAAGPRGSIRGLIMDARGNPLVGAAVLVMADSEDAKTTRVVRRANTDNEGKFIAAGITPGRYRLKAEASGFTPVEMATEVRPNKVTVFDSILLRRVGTLGEETGLNKDSKYAGRVARGTIFHNQEVTKDPTAEKATDTVALTDRTPEIHGVVQTFAQTTAGNSPEQSSFVGANFAVSEQIGKDASVVISGQVGRGNAAPQHFEALTTAHAGDRHRFQVALGYGRFTFSRRSGTPRLGQFSVSATDTWQVSGPVLIVYGMEFARFAEGASGTSLLPRFGIAVDAGPRTRVFAGMLPGSSDDIQSKINLESGEIEFTEPKPVVMGGGPGGLSEPVMDRSYRLQFGAEQVLSDKSSVEMMAFFDTVSGHGVGLLAVPGDGARTEPEMLTAAMKGRSRGIRVVYHRRVNDLIEGSVGYSFGEGQRLDARGITEPAQLFKNENYHVISAKVDANFVQTGTHVSTVLRLAPSQALFAIDPFQGQIATYDPNVSVSLMQELPSISFVPGQWTALVDLRNLFDQQGAIAEDRQELVASRYHRLVRVGLSVRF